MTINALYVFVCFGERQVLGYRMEFVIILNRVPVGVAEFIADARIGCTIVTSQVAGFFLFDAFIECHMAGRTVGQVAVDAAIGLDLVGELLGNPASPVFVNGITVVAERPACESVADYTERIVLGVDVRYQEIAVQVVVWIMACGAFNVGTLIQLDTHGTQE